MTGSNGILVESTSPWAWAAEHWPLRGTSHARRPACSCLWSAFSKAKFHYPPSQRQCLPSGCIFNMKREKKKNKTFKNKQNKNQKQKTKNRHHYLHSSVSAVRNLDHLHSFQALISENSHFRNKTPWKCSTSKFSYSLWCYSFLHQFLCLPNRSLKIV